MEIYILLILWIIIYGLYFYTKNQNGLHMLQLESYKNKRYIKWIKNNIKKISSYKEIFLIIICIIFFLINKEFLGLILLNITYFCLLLLKREEKAKKPFVITNRIKRMYITYGIINALIIGIFVFLNYKILTIILNIFTILSYLIVILINIINSPIEKLIQKNFYNKAKQKLEDMPNLKVIGITGSYGKTSTKYIVSTILSQKYNVLMTPESYNTNYGGSKNN